MTLLEMLGGYSLRKTVWSKRGGVVTRQDVNVPAPLDIAPRTRLVPAPETQPGSAAKTRGACKSASAGFACLRAPPEAQADAS